MFTHIHEGAIYKNLHRSVGGIQAQKKRNEIDLEMKLNETKREKE